MAPAEEDHAGALFHRALDLPAPEREAFVRREAAGRQALVDEVLALLAADRAETQPGLRSPWLGEPGAVAAQQLGPYRLLEEVGEGGMGRVFRAEQTAPIHRVVAVKILKALAATASSEARFEREVEALQRLQHRAIARVLDRGRTPAGRPFVVMEYVGGQPLQRWRATGPSLDERLDLLLEVCDAVQHAHQKGVIHRDLKPANILVQRVGTRVEPRVIDFGIARIDGLHDGEQPALTAGGAAMGTAGYMSPEQVLDAAGADARSDVYSLGVIAYELLTGRLPRSGTLSTPPMAWVAVPPRPSRLVAPCRLPSDLDAVLLRALALEPERRYATVQEFAGDVGRARRHEPVQARVPTWTYVGARFVRRHRVATATAAAFALLLLGALLLVSSAWREAERNWNDYRRLVDDKLLQDLATRARDELWPPWPTTISAFDDWRRQAEALLQRGPELLRRRESLGERMQAATGGERDELAWQGVVLDRLLAGLDRLRAPEPTEDNLAGIAARRAEAERIGRVSLVEAKAAWQQAVAAIADRRRCPAYEGLVLAPQVGLVPLGRNAASGLYEFWHVESGNAPEVRRDAAGDLVELTVREDTGMVFVLVPGGRFTMGAIPAGDAHAGTAAIDPDVAPMERFVHDLLLAPFFVARHECTQGQWLRLGGGRPSFVTASSKSRGHRGDLRHPVEQVDWESAVRLLRRHGLELPTEAQWEYFARAGSRTVFGGVADPAALAQFANLADAGSEGNLRVPLEPGLDDGFALTAPVGSFRANGFGLFDCHGNVAEWCRDWLVPYARPPQPGHGLREPQRPEDQATLRVSRGGDFAERRLLSRVASRNGQPPEQRTARTGLRAVRTVSSR